MEQLEMSSIMDKAWDGTGATGSAEVVKGPEQRHSRPAESLTKSARYQKSNLPSPSMILKHPFHLR
jgi:hypothetical protein